MTVVSKVYTALINGIIHTGVDKDPIEGGVLIEGDKIIAVGKFEIPKGSEVIDLEGDNVFPGFIDPHTHIGLIEQAKGPIGVDGNEATSPITADVFAVDGIYPPDNAFKEAIAAGITASMVVPGSANIIGGVGSVIKHYSKDNLISSLVIKEYGGMKAALGENPKRAYGSRKITPSTRMASAAIMRQWLIKAQEYYEKKKNAEKEPDKMPAKDLKLENLSMVFEGKMPLKVHAHRADDIATALRIADEFSIPITIEHASEAHLIVDHVKKYPFSMVVGPSLGVPTKVETKNKSLKGAKILSDAGVNVALTTDHPVLPIYRLLHAAAQAVKDGLDEFTALQMITINPAKVLGLESKVGSIEVGKDADITVYRGHPFDFLSTCKYTFVSGKKAFKR
ncbi:amidohydrolase [Proteinivorax hydrogeniformans]|uniref:Amidohydrolase n=1 Tax=Proteinivorax hydrogeniformans TaxID=1826727 RepID=A0AAU8HRG0_9FIRM